MGDPYDGLLVGRDAAPVEERPAAPMRLGLEEETDPGGDVTHEQIRREWDARLTRDVAAHVVTPAELEEARLELEQGAPWAQSL